MIFPNSFEPIATTIRVRDDEVFCNQLGYSNALLWCVSDSDWAVGASGVQICTGGIESYGHRIICICPIENRITPATTTSVDPLA